MEGVLGYIALGTNLGDRAGHLRSALHGLRRAQGITVLGCSPIYEAAAHTLDLTERQPAYLNAVAEVRTAYSPSDLLAICQRLELAAGRSRRVRWAPRTLDLDLLTLGMQRFSGPDLELPHPRLAERRFVLQPWADLSPNHYIGDPFGATVAALLSQCPDRGAIRRTNIAWQIFSDVDS